jgi:hypothetical protein
MALIKQELARKIFGSATNAMNRYYKAEDASRILRRTMRSDEH